MITSTRMRISVW